MTTKIKLFKDLLSKDLEMTSTMVEPYNNALIIKSKSVTRTTF